MQILAKKAMHNSSPLLSFISGPTENIFFSVVLKNSSGEKNIYKSVSEKF